MKAGFVLYAVCFFSHILLQNATVKKLENHHTGSWGHVEQQSGGICRKQFDFFFFLNKYLNLPMKAVFVLYAVCFFSHRLLQNSTVKQV